MTENKISSVFKTIWSGLKIVGIIVLAIFGVKLAQKIIKAVKGSVYDEKGFIPDEDSTFIWMKNKKGQTVKVKLPEGVTSNKVDKAGFGTGGKVTVEVKKHETIDIDNLPDADTDSFNIG